MKSLHDEIRTYVRDKEDGFNFIASKANDFIRASRGFHRANGAISLKNYDHPSVTMGGFSSLYGSNKFMEEENNAR